MAKLGVITLGLNPQEDYLRIFLEDLERVSGMDTNVFDYKSLNEVDDSIDILVLSPGEASIGLDTDERFIKDPAIRSLYKLIREFEGPILGVNAGHEALNCAYGWAIDEIPDDLKDEYQRNQVFDFSSIDDFLVSGVDDISMQLSNDYAVLPLEKQAKRPLQDKVTPLINHMGYPLISRVESEAPVYGVQFNIQPGTEKVFENFFRQASHYPTSK